MPDELLLRAPAETAEAMVRSAPPAPPPAGAPPPRPPPAGAAPDLAALIILLAAMPPATVPPIMVAPVEMALVTCWPTAPALRDGDAARRSAAKPGARHTMTARRTQTRHMASASF